MAASSAQLNVFIRNLHLPALWKDSMAQLVKNRKPHCAKARRSLPGAAVPPPQCAPQL